MKAINDVYLRRLVFLDALGIPISEDYKFIIFKLKNYFSYQKKIEISSYYNLNYYKDRINHLCYFDETESILFYVVEESNGNHSVVLNNNYTILQKYLYDRYPDISVGVINFLSVIILRRTGVVFYGYLIDYDYGSVISRQFVHLKKLYEQKYKEPVVYGKQIEIPNF